MRIEHEPTLDFFRTARRCEWAGCPGLGMEPHHFYAKGLGSGHRMDVRINLIALCRLHHNMAHSGQIARAALLAIIAQRQGEAPQDVLEALWVIDRLPKKSSVVAIRKAMDGLAEPVRLLVERALWESGVFGVDEEG